MEQTKQEILSKNNKTRLAKPKDLSLSIDKTQQGSNTSDKNYP